MVSDVRSTHPEVIRAVSAIPEAQYDNPLDDYQDNSINKRRIIATGNFIDSLASDMRRWIIPNGVSWTYMLGYRPLFVAPVDLSKLDPDKVSVNTDNNGMIIYNMRGGFVGDLINEVPKEAIPFKSGQSYLEAFHEHEK